MPRSYNAKVVALTIGQSFKWVDNVLSQHTIPGVLRARQGVARAISDGGLLAVEIIRLLSIEAGVPIRRAVDIASRAAASERPRGRLTVAADVVLEIDLDAIERRLQPQLIAAIEAVSRPRRARPPLRSRPGD